MTEPFVGEIQLFGFNFNPVGWALCNGATLPIQQNTALFSLLGTQYGGNGSTTFQLPNFSARAGCGQGQGSGLTSRQIGETFGSITAALSVDQMPTHSHGITVFSQSDATKKSGSPTAGAALSLLSAGVPKLYIDTPINTQFAQNLSTEGGNLPHENQQPYLALNFCIALQGVFPSFS
jgi:microcystin-dependent protein